jgi:putative NADH-flavin reductase
MPVTDRKSVMMKAVVLGASGATGKLVVAELLERNIKVVSITGDRSAGLSSVEREDASYK